MSKKSQQEVLSPETVRYHIYPDGVIDAREKGGYQRTLAIWRPGNRPDGTNETDEGTIWHDDRVYTSKANWDKAVRQKLNLDDTEYVAEAWRGGSLVHKGDLIREQADVAAWRKLLVGKSRAYSRTKPKKPHKSRNRKGTNRDIELTGVKL